MKQVKRICIVAGVAVAGLLMARYLLARDAQPTVQTEEKEELGNCVSTLMDVDEAMADTMPSPTDAEMDAMLKRLNNYHGNDEKEDEKMLNALKDYKKRQAQR